jgi:hydrogenase-4 component B
VPLAPPAIALAVAAGIAILAATSGIAGLAFMKLFGIAFLGEQRDGREIVRERSGPSTTALAWLAGLAILFGVAPSLLAVPLAGVASALTGVDRLDAGALPTLGALLALLPLLAGAAAVVAAKRGGARTVPTWTCGSEVTPRSQYTATAFSKPLRRIFGFVLFPDHTEIRDTGASRWFPIRIRYEVTTRYIIDDVARTVAAIGQRLARRTRIVQAGFLRIYLMYAVVALIVILVAAR